MSAEPAGEPAGEPARGSRVAGNLAAVRCPPDGNRCGSRITLLRKSGAKHTCEEGGELDRPQRVELMELHLITTLKGTELLFGDRVAER